MNQHRAIRVLIVDDHDLFRTGLRSLLEDEGFEVMDASGGAEGARRARGFQPDVVVMDMNMPEMTGVEATPLVLEAAPAASVLMLTIATATNASSAPCARVPRVSAQGRPARGDRRGLRAAADGHSAIAPRVAGALLHSVRSTAPRHRRSRSRPSCRTSPRASSTCSSWSRRATTTRTSRPACTSARARSRTTSPSCSTSSASTTGPGRDVRAAQRPRLGEVTVSSPPLARRRGGRTARGSRGAGCAAC